MFKWFEKKEVVDQRQKVVFINDYNKTVMDTLYINAHKPFLYQYAGIIPSVGTTVLYEGLTWKVVDIWMYLDAIPAPDNTVVKIYMRYVK